MKKVLSLVLVLLLCIMSLTVSASASTPPQLIGDMNSDSTVNILDVTLIQRLLVDAHEPGFLDIIGDFDRDGVVSIADATWIQRQVAGLEIPSYCGGIVYTDIYIDFAADVASGEAKVGTPVEFTAEAWGSGGDFTYEFYIDDVLVQPRSENNTLIYTFEHSGEYTVWVYVYNYAGVSKYDVMWSYEVVENDSL